MNELMIKVSIAASILIAIVFSSPVFAYAETRTASPSAKLEARQADAMTRLRTKADAEINRRINSLNEVSTRLNNSAKLSATDKSSLTTSVQNEITGLTTLKTKIDGDTQITTLRTDVQSIVKDYRVYALLMPKISIVVVADTIVTNVDKVTDTLNTKIQPRIQSAQAAGKDVTTINAAMSDMQSKLADAKLQAQKAESTVMPLTPDGYPGNKSTLTAARANLMTARQDLEAARKDVATITAQLKSFNAK